MQLVVGTRYCNFSADCSNIVALLPIIMIVSWLVMASRSLEEAQMGKKEKESQYINRTMIKYTFCIQAGGNTV